MNKPIYILLLITSLFAACKKDVPPVKQSFTGTITSGSRVFVSNEGNYQFGNASVSLYDASSGNAIEDIYKPNNNNQSIGDVCQSLYLMNNSIYAVINNSSKVVCLDKNTFVKTGTISGLTSPRYFLPVSNNKAYVSDLYANAISIVNLSNNTKTGSIHCNGWTEEMVLSYGKVFVTNIRKEYVYVINSSSDQIIDSILVAYGSSSIVKDQNENIWVACSGDSLKNSLPRLVCINPITLQVEKSLVFPHYSDSPSQLKINGSGNQLYYLNSNVYTLAINATSLPTTPLITKGNKLFYALGIHPTSEDVYVSDAIDYVQKGKVIIYTKQGVYQSVFTAGTIPGNIVFE